MDYCARCGNWTTNLREHNHPKFTRDGVHFFSACELLQGAGLEIVDELETLQARFKKREEVNA